MGKEGSVLRGGFPNGGKSAPPIRYIRHAVERQAAPVRAKDCFGLIDFPMREILKSCADVETQCPDRDIALDKLSKHARFCRSVNIMAKRNLTPAEIGEIVSKIRKAAGLRQDQLAGAAGAGLRFIVDLEAGKSTA